MRERKAIAHGPYRRGSKFRVVETSATGARSTCSFDTESEAIKYIAEFNDEAEGRSVSGVMDDYLDHLEAQGLKQSTRTTLSYRLKAIMRVVARDRLLSSVTPAIAAGLYQQRVNERRTDTQRGELAAATAMFAWCVSKGWLRANPFADVAPQGRKARRHNHLRINEAKAFFRVALADLSDAGLAAAMAVTMGLRASELTDRLVRDVDDSARVLWVTDAKTEAGVRCLDIAQKLRMRLSLRVADRDGGERLFGDVDRRWLNYHVARLCKLAKVPVVSPHALRRTWSAIGAETMPVEHVAAVLGQADAGVNRRHYQPTNAEERRVGAAVMRSITGGRK